MATATTLRICTYYETAPHGCGGVAHAWGYDERGRYVLKRVCNFCPDQLGIAASLRRAADELRAAAADIAAVTDLAGAAAAALSESADPDA